MIYLVRHGETDFNRFSITQGHTDTSLNKKGLEQAQNLSEKLKNYNFDIVFCSSLTRAKQTCDYIMKYHNCPVYYDSRLMERGKGVLERHKNTPEKYAEFFADPHKFSGETEEDVLKRVSAFLRDLKKYKKKNILIVSHGGVYAYIKHYLEKKDIRKDPIEKLDMENCQIIEMVF